WAWDSSGLSDDTNWYSIIPNNVNRLVVVNKGVRVKVVDIEFNNGSGEILYDNEFYGVSVARTEKQVVHVFYG
ncbi:44806_t:CDS:1, partial [Gigaspora margarita]